MLHTSHSKQTDRHVESVKDLPHYATLELLLAISHFNCGNYENCVQHIDSMENTQEKMFLLYLKGMDWINVGNSFKISVVFLE